MIAIYNNVLFGVDSVFSTPPIPCGYKRNGRTCLRTSTHTHLTRTETHTFLEPGDRQSDDLSFSTNILQDIIRTRILSRSSIRDVKQGNSLTKICTFLFNDGPFIIKVPVWA